DPGGASEEDGDDSELQGFALDESKFEEGKHPRGAGGQFGSGGHAAASKLDPHTAAGGAKTTRYTAGGPDDPAKKGESSVRVTKEYTYAGQPDDPGHENP